MIEFTEWDGTSGLGFGANIVPSTSTFVIRIRTAYVTGTNWQAVHVVDRAREIARGLRDWDNDGLRRAIADFRAIDLRRRNQQTHRPPPVSLDLSTYAERVTLIDSQRWPPACWRVSRQAGVRERKPRRRRIRVWEREEF